ncbi:hypothetical protein MVEN_00734800 [Mycena venus]|uniref:F-box domain-containing protein n=1 Tax=Mycena venus TaxID=2733690 RepID=A0A8H6YK53_9AGAR|nr:hypothetical protein MVEN_00734800 [Mycena venus]
MSPELPPEIWDLVFENLPRHSILTLRTVSSFFYDLSPPWLYRQFRYRFGIFVKQPGESYVQRRLDRLSFWSSGKAAPHVLGCYIYYSDARSFTGPLMNALFEAIPHFSNLQSLSCNFDAFRAELPLLRVENLMRLRRLHIHGGELSRANEPTAFKLSVSHFGYTAISVPRSYDGVERSSVLSLLDPATLSSLELGAGSDPGAPEHFLADKTIVASFHNLRTLSITFWEITDFACVHAAIAPFPAIEDLILDTVHPCKFVPGSLRSELVPLVPLLRRYKGPIGLLPLVLPGSHPAQLTLMRGSSTDLLQALLRTRYDAESITALAIRVLLHADICEGTVLLELLALFPNLTRLAIYVSSDDAGGSDASEAHAAEHVCHRLVNILTVPPALRYVVFRWRLGQQDGELVPDVAQLNARLRSVNPGLPLEVAFSSLAADAWGF